MKKANWIEANKLVGPMFLDNPTTLQGCRVQSGTILNLVPFRGVMKTNTPPGYAVRCGTERGKTVQNNT